MARREDHIRRKNMTIMVVLGIALLAIFLTNTEFGAVVLDQFFGENKTKTEIRPLADPVAGTFLEVYYIDVGQGDAELLRIPQEDGGYFTMLVDSGEHKAYGQVKALLDSLGVQKIDALMVSHPHSDHMGGMAKVIENFEIGAFYMPPIPENLMPTTVSYEKMLDALAAKNLKITALTAGTTIPNIGTAAVNVLGPIPDKEYDNLNNCSIVFKLIYGQNSFLFSGDAEKEAWTDILESGYNPNAQVLKVSHHGSSNGTSSALLDQITPLGAVISCGAGNDYGHPHQETLELFKNFGCPLYRTDTDGTILARADGKSPVTYEKIQ